MGPSWAHALAVAGLVTLGGTPLLRHVALATAFVDDPAAAHKSHKEPTPYLGGVGLIVAVLLGLAFTSRLTPLVGVVALGGPLIGCLGLLDDHRSVGALFRFGIEMGVAAIALAAGLRIHATDIRAIDGLITVIWVVGVTNAVNLLDNMDGLAAGVSAAAGTAIFAIAVLGEQPVLATVVAGLVGACVGFLAYNKRPASIFMGDTGSLFLGFVLAVSAIDVSPALPPPTSFAVPLMLLALPVLDTLTVTISRLRRGRSVAQGGRDHLSHRLATRGLSRGRAVWVLVLLESSVGMLAVLAARDVIALLPAVVIAGALLSALVLVTCTAPVYAEPVTGLPRSIRLAAAGAALALIVLVSPAVVALARARGPGVTGAAATRQAVASLTSGDGARAAALFERAGNQLGQAERLLNGRMTSLGLAVPILRANVATTRALVKSGLQVDEAGQRLAAIAEAADIPVTPTSAPGESARRLAPGLAGAASVLDRAAATLSGYDRPYLWPSLGANVRELRGQLTRAAAEAASAAEAARLFPALLGQEGPRRYFLAVQDNGELRGAGGVVRLWGELMFDHGRLGLTRLGSIDELNQAGAGRSLLMPPEFLDRYRQFDVGRTWENVNVSPDFTVTGQVISSLYPQSGGSAVDGVIAIDVPGLATMLELTGPVRVDGWPEPLSAPTLVDVVERASYQRLSAADRPPFVARAVTAIIEALASADLGTPSRLAARLGPAVRGRHLQFYAGRSDEEALAQRLGADGQLPAARGDSLLIVNQNLNATAIDSFLSRQVHYDVRLEPQGPQAKLSARVDVTMRNDSPAAGLSQALIGPHDDRFAAGENRTYLSVYSPLLLTGSRLDGAATTVGADPELGRRAYSTSVSIPAQQSRTVGLDLQGAVPLEADGWYHLDVLHQPSLNADSTRVDVHVPSGWRILEARGLRLVDARQATATLRPRSDSDVAVRLQRTPWARLVH